MATTPKYLLPLPDESLKVSQTPATLRDQSNGIETVLSGFSGRITTAEGVAAAAAPTAIAAVLPIKDYAEAALVNAEIARDAARAAETQAKQAKSDAEAAASIAGSAVAPSDLGTLDLDTLKSSGVWYQATAADATTARHYPVVAAGRLQIVKGGDSVGQMYTSADGKKIFIRGFEGTTWGAWTLLLTPADITGKTDKSYVDSQITTRAPVTHTHTWSQVTSKPTTFVPSSHGHAGADITSGTINAARLPGATQSAAGTMSAADKKKLDGATASSVVNSVMLRNSAGRTQVANPSSGADVANKSYVDSAVSDYRRAASGVRSIGTISSGGSAVNQTVTFPAGRFSATPNVTVTGGHSRHSIGIQSVNTSGFTFTCSNWSSNLAEASEIYWIAVQA